MRPLGTPRSDLLCVPRRGGRLSGIRTGIHARVLLRPAVSGAERFPALTRRQARRTIALTAQLTDTALFLGGRAGANLCGRMAVTT